MNNLRTRQKDFTISEGSPLSDQEDCFKEGEALAAELTKKSVNHENLAAADAIKQAIEEVKVCFAKNIHSH